VATPLLIVDAFTDRPFAGNPAAVCFLGSRRDEKWMQRVATEMNLSETAFLLPQDDGYDLRWFTPKVEVALCGHATLASAHALWETGRLAGDSPARFRTQSGLLTCERRGAWIEMDFPASSLREAAPPPGLLEALGAKPVQLAHTGTDFLLELADETTVRALAPDFGRLRQVETRGTIVTARSRAGHDFVSRFFAPAVGIDEDPVTGSAHCALAVWWGRKLGKEELTGWQASARGGEVRMRLAGKRVMLSGQAVTVLRGELP